MKHKWEILAVFQNVKIKPLLKNIVKCIVVKINFVAEKVVHIVNITHAKNHAAKDVLNMQILD